MAIVTRSLVVVGLCTTNTVGGNEITGGGDLARGSGYHGGAFFDNIVSKKAMAAAVCPTNGGSGFVNHVDKLLGVGGSCRSKFGPIDKADDIDAHCFSSTAAAIVGGGNSGVAVAAGQVLSDHAYTGGGLATSWLGDEKIEVVVGGANKDQVIGSGEEDGADVELTINSLGLANDCMASVNVVPSVSLDVLLKKKDKKYKKEDEKKVSVGHGAASDGSCLTMLSGCLFPHLSKMKTASFQSVDDSREIRDGALTVGESTAVRGFGLKSHHCIVYPTSSESVAGKDDDTFVLKKSGVAEGMDVSGTSREERSRRNNYGLLELYEISAKEVGKIRPLVTGVPNKGAGGSKLTELSPSDHDVSMVARHLVGTHDDGDDSSSNDMEEDHTFKRTEARKMSYEHKAREDGRECSTALNSSQPSEKWYEKHNMEAVDETKTFEGASSNCKLSTTWSTAKGTSGSQRYNSCCRSSILETNEVVSNGIKEMERISKMWYQQAGIIFSVFVFPLAGIVVMLVYFFLAYSDVKLVSMNEYVPSLFVCQMNESEGRKGHGKAKEGMDHPKDSLAVVFKGHRFLVASTVMVALCLVGSVEGLRISADASQERPVQAESAGNLANLTQDDSSSTNVASVVSTPTNFPLDLTNTELQDYEGVEELIVASNDIAQMLSEVQLLASDDSVDPLEALRATSKAMSFARDRMTDLELSAIMPSHLQPLLKNTVNGLANAEKHLKTIGEIVSQNYGISKGSSDSKRRILSSKEESPTNHGSRHRSLSKADYYNRAKSHHGRQSQGFLPGLNSHFDHQQGYRRARSTREDGGAGRRLQSGDSAQCVGVDPETQKVEQCLRLALCANNYGLYDMFVYFFGDDIAFDNGGVDDKITVYDEDDLQLKLEEVLHLSSRNNGILKEYNEISGELTGDHSILDPVNGKCDKLLQQFHRVDESLGINGKWTGGSVTSVCRGWGSSKFFSLGSIYDVNDAAGLDFDEKVEECLQDLVDNFNDAIRDGKLLDRDPQWCTGSKLSSTNKTLCCDSDCLTCGGNGNKFTGSQCLGEFDEVVKKPVNGKDVPITDKTECCNLTNGCCESGCCDRDIGPRTCTTLDLDDCKIDTSVENILPVPNNPCKEELDSEFDLLSDDAIPEFFNVWAQSDLSGAFKCLYYSYFVLEEDGDCDTLDSSKQSECKESCMGRTKSIFVGKRPSGSTNIFSYWDYDYPIVLPTPSVARSGAIKPWYGRFIVDIVADIIPDKAAILTVDVFDEYMGCVSDLVATLYAKYPDDVQKIFKNNEQGTNPYAIKVGDQQFQLPLRVSENDNRIDSHGQLKRTPATNFLDVAFEYGNVLGGRYGIDTTVATPKLSKKLKNSLIGLYTFGDRLDEDIEFYEECSEDDDEDTAGLCKEKLADLQELKDSFVARGLTRDQLDASIALTLGNSTSIGQVCAYSKGLKDDNIDLDNIPGFCCLDAPYENTKPFEGWGETFSCQKYELNADGSTTVVQKDTTDCNTLGPVTSGFNQAACDVFQGKWCPVPRSCFDLVKCVRELKDQIKESRSRQAFFGYLDGAPVLNDADGETEDPEKCGDLREYFEYERDYTDDDRICEEVKDLQCFTDFENLDAFAEGVLGAGGDGESANPDEKLAVSTEIQEIVEEKYNEVASKAWRSSNYALGKVIDLIELYKKAAEEPAEATCLVAVSGIVGSAAPCAIPVAVSKYFTATNIGLARVALSISEQLFNELATPSPSEPYSSFEDDRQRSIYKNGITSIRNSITIFQATQQLKSILGNIENGLEEDRAAETRRRLKETCFDTAELGYQDPGTCDLPSCEDFTRLCDRSYNLPYIAIQKGAGCDQLDSDGSGKPDDCEDRFPPEVLLRNAEIFRCDDTNFERLCYIGKVFKNQDQVNNFLDYQFPPSDDCQSLSRLSVKIEKTNGECHNTEYTLTPIQDISECNHGTVSGPFDIIYENPLPGPSKVVTLQLDDEPPSVECGFHGVGGRNMIIGNTLYHYALPTDVDQSRLKDARFYYNVTDNCNADVEINVVVTSNEVQQNKITKLFTRKREGFEEQVEFLYAPTHCDCKNKGFNGLCKTDASMGELKTRYYDVTVKASDSAKNTVVTTCRVVIIPLCNPSDEDCEDVDGLQYYTKEAVNESVGQSKVRFCVAEEQLIWDTELLPPETNEETGEAVDIDEDSPAVTCNLATQNLAGNGIGIFTDLKFTFTAVDTGNKCTATEDLEVTIEVLSNEVVATGEDMVIFSEPSAIGIPSIWAKDHTCKTKTKGKCKVSAPKKSRVYTVRVTATDEAGNTKSTECSTVVGRDPEGSNPLFVIAKLDIIGGVEENDIPVEENIRNLK
eukprot:CAMPEP_0183744146 /NCGR_PEP_ID=MMETSP0737-20130205/65580_1 /TAXON_ID=385413 /ORGANISM="Thalassiosira miniscula, Strain CCMP1093" /LENGTH=2327 /DNA_ID=CAMNT_0025979781 /DNA_START=237 /DNA_END=7220 /DNA_ORIENTATION=-